MGATKTRLSQRFGWVWCALAAVLFGAATPTIKLVAGDTGAVTIAGLLYLGAALAVAPLAVRQRPSASSSSQRSRLMTAVLVGGGMAPVLLVLAIERTPASTVSLFLNLEVVATAVIARVFLAEDLGRRAWLGIGIVVMGGAILAGTGSTSIAAGAVLVAGACVCWGIDNAITASLDAFSPSFITLAKGLVAGSVNLLLGIWLFGAPGAGLVWVALVVGALGYGASITMWITGARLIGAARGQAVFALAPCIGAALSWPINGDRPGALTMLAFAVSLVGVVVIVTSRHSHGHVHEPIEHAHEIDPTDVHHAPGAIEPLGGTRHRHLALAHEHEHFPDIHHRHVH